LLSGGYGGGYRFVGCGERYCGHFKDPLKKWRGTMNYFQGKRPALALTILLIFVSLTTLDRPVAANNQEGDPDDIIGVWRWEWTNNLDYTGQDCPGGYGTMTVTKANGRQPIAFKGKTGTEGEDVSNNGSWEYVGTDASNNNRRKYRLKWGNDTDTVLLSDAGNYLRGTNGNGKCIVKGSKSSAK
jgi:hypothetical protein